MQMCGAAIFELLESINYKPSSTHLHHYTAPGRGLSFTMLKDGLAHRYQIAVDRMLFRLFKAGTCTAVKSSAKELVKLLKFSPRNSRSNKLLEPQCRDLV